MTTIETNGRTLIVVEVPEDAKRFEITTYPKYLDPRILYEFGLLYDLAGVGIGRELPDGDYKILGTVHKGVVSFDPEPFVEGYTFNTHPFFRQFVEAGVKDVIYPDYAKNKPQTAKDGTIPEGDDHFFSSAKDSFLSLLHSHGVKTELHHVIIEKI